MRALAYRPAEERDQRFIRSTFLDSFRASHSAGLIAMEDWPDVMGPQIDRILSRPGCALFVAHHPDESEDDWIANLYGWIAVERGFCVPSHVWESGEQVRILIPSIVPLVHYVYVTQAFRQMGIARGLFKAADVDPEKPFYYSAKTGTASRLRGKAPGGEHRPLIARFPPTGPTRRATEDDSSSDETKRRTRRRRSRGKK